LATTGEVLGVKSAKLYSEIYAVPALKSLVNDPALAPTPQMAFFGNIVRGSTFIRFRRFQMLRPISKPYRARSKRPN